MVQVQEGEQNRKVIRNTSSDRKRQTSLIQAVNEVFIFNQTTKSHGKGFAEGLPNFDTFISGIQISQINKFEWVVYGEADNQLMLLRKTNIRVYQELVTKFNADLVATIDINKELITRPGGIPYLAMVSHSLSHTQFWPEVEESLKSAFSSEKKQGIKRNKYEIHY